jgi:hypothetical protein
MIACFDTNVLLSDNRLGRVDYAPEVDAIPLGKLESATTSSDVFRNRHALKGARRLSSRSKSSGVNRSCNAPVRLLTVQPLPRQRRPWSLECSGARPLHRSAVSVAIPGPFCVCRRRCSPPYRGHSTQRHVPETQSLQKRTRSAAGHLTRNGRLLPKIETAAGGAL